MLWNWFGFGRGTPPDRLLFPYRDGTRVRRADPVVIEQILAEKLGAEWYRVVGELSAPLPPGVLGTAADAARAQREKTRRNVLDATCAAFDVREYKHGTPGPNGEPPGLTVIELYGLLDGYSRFAAGLLEIARPFASAQSRASPSPEPPPAPNGADSISAEPASPEPRPETSPTP